MPEKRDQDTPRTPADARKHLRSPLIILKVRLEDGGKAFFGYARNISRSGMFISTVNPRDPGNRFPVEIPLPPPLNRRVTCNCEVVWRRLYDRTSPYEPGMGLKFLDLPGEDAEAVDEWIHDHPEAQGEN
ncbi:hypothetical protein DESUT3_04080 [Desulfuromonas versatilis]|uniref:PilZ domain-containing protein n=1 Tax=Desulfuromonas versatilis TaxID=2802975 RepID=A0ABN6DV06_9BACT|nr:PilZ domain-containing protein [Desulfuromonas versatilis]BCR03339.1 hypothetical protein DESUT3_04080 [Desulfuromonas versatilis]